PRPQPGRCLVSAAGGAGPRTQLKFPGPRGPGPAAASASPSPGEDCPCCEEEGTPGQGTPGPSAPVTISEGPGREAFTAFPWLNLGLGLGGIAALALAFWAGRRLGRTAGAARAAEHKSAPGEAGWTRRLRRPR